MTKQRTSRISRLIVAAGAVLGLAFASPASAADLEGLLGPRPVVTMVSPASGSTGGGSEVTITGTSLNTAVLVTFGVLPGVLTSVSRTSLTVRTPPHSAGTVDVRVWALAGVSKVTDVSRYTFVALEPVTMLSVEQSMTSGLRLAWANPFSDGFQGVMIRRNTGLWAPTTPFSGILAEQTSGYENRWADSGRTRGRTYSYSVFADYGELGFAPAASLTVTLPTREMMTGTVRDSAGAPIPEVTVVVLDGQGLAAAHTTTGADGAYEVAGLAAGDYTVCFEPGDAGDAGLGYRPECWPDVAPDGEPTPVSLDPSTTLSDIDAALASGSVLSGRVSDAAGMPIKGVAISIDDEGGSPLAIAFTQADGTWRASGLDPGRYSVCFDPRTTDADAGYAPQCYPGLAPTATPEAITVDAGSVATGIDAVLDTTEPDEPGMAGVAAVAAVGPRTIRSVELSDVPCRDIMFLAARGSGEPGPGGTKDRPDDPYVGVGARVLSAYEEFESRIGDDRWITPPISVMYPAEGIELLVTPGLADDYFRGLDFGVFEARRALRARAEMCPTERFVIAGYSQGAMVMHRVLHNLGTPSAGPLHADVFNRIDAAILIADGDQVPFDFTRRYGSAPKSAQGAGLRWSDQFATGTLNAYLHPSIGAKTFSVCYQGDVVCDTTVNPVRAIQNLNVHSRSYTRSSGVIRAAWDAADRALQFTLPPPVITTVDLPPATAGRWYTEPLTTADGRLGSWSVAAGELPDGLEIEPDLFSAGYVIDGIPTSAGTSSFTIRFDDHYGQSATVDLTLVVEPAPPDPDPPAPTRPDNLADLPLPEDAAAGQRAEFETAACGAHVCAAAGPYRDDNGHHQEALWLWSDGSWTVSRAPMPADSTGARVRAELMSCGGDTCAIWGRYDGDAQDTPVAWTWSAGSWTAAMVAPPDVGHPASAYIDTLSCGSGVCAASGAYTDDTGTGRTVLWAWSDGMWTATPPPLPGGTPAGDEYVLYMSCGTDICAAAGVTQRSPSVAHAAWSWSDGSWTLATADVLTPDDGIWNTACLDETCFIVGNFDDTTGLVQYSEGNWIPVTLPVSAASPSLWLVFVNDVSCGAQECIAPGQYVDTDGSVHNAWWSWTDSDWTVVEGSEPMNGKATCGSGICAVTSSDTFWVRESGSSTVERLAIPSNAVLYDTGLAGPKCGTDTCGFVGMFRDIGGIAHEAVWLWSDGAWSTAELPAPATSYYMVADALTCGAGLCLVGATHADDFGEHRLWWSWAGDDET